MAFHLDPAMPTLLAEYLAARELIDAAEAVVSVDKAGPGNMNLTLRVRTQRRSLVVKQAREWVERYPQIAAPPERARVEAAFYGAVAGVPEVAGRMPRLLYADAESALLVLEDLGPSTDYLGLYDDRGLDDEELDALLRWLGALHRVSAPADPLLANRAMRTLNHEHVFVLPFRPHNGLDLDAHCPGLGAAARSLIGDAGLVARIREIGRLYLSDGPALVHGDFYPGSWLRSPDGPKVIDPEFAFLGDPGWDYGVLAAHLVLAQQSDHLVDHVLAESPDHTCVFAAVEVLRRLLGVAQLPLRADLAARRAMIDRAVAMLDPSA